MCFCYAFASCPHFHEFVSFQAFGLQLRVERHRMADDSMTQRWLFSVFFLVRSFYIAMEMRRILGARLKPIENVVDYNTETCEVQGGARCCKWRREHCFICFMVCVQQDDTKMQHLRQTERLNSCGKTVKHAHTHTHTLFFRYGHLHDLSFLCWLCARAEDDDGSLLRIGESPRHRGAVLSSVLWVAKQNKWWWFEGFEFDTCFDTCLGIQTLLNLEFVLSNCLKKRIIELVLQADNIFFSTFLTGFCRCSGFFGDFPCRFHVFFSSLSSDFGGLRRGVRGLWSRWGQVLCDSKQWWKKTSTYVFSPETVYSHVSNYNVIPTIFFHISPQKTITSFRWLSFFFGVMSPDSLFGTSWKITACAAAVTKTMHLLL